MKAVDTDFELVQILDLCKVASDSNFNKISLAKEVLFILLKYWPIWVEHLVEDLFDHFVNDGKLRKFW